MREERGERREERGEKSALLTTAAFIDYRKRIAEDLLVSYPPRRLLPHFLVLLLVLPLLVAPGLLLGPRRCGLGEGHASASIAVCLHALRSARG